MYDFSGKIALVTGGNQGIGEGIVDVFADEGATIIIAARNTRNNADAVVQAARAKGVDCIFIQTDVEKTEDIDRLFSIINEKYGRLDFLINNAGHGTSGCKNVLDTPADCWDSTIKCLLTAPFYMSQKFFPLLRETGGRIVNIGSAAGQTGGGGTGVDYSAGKGGLVTLTAYMCRDFTPLGVNVNTIACGVINSPILEKYPPEALERLGRGCPVGRIGTPREVGLTAAFLCSEGASYISGQVIGVNGGSLCKAL